VGSIGYLFQGFLRMNQSESFDVVKEVNDVEEEI
jgi:hypothetical protein